MKNLTIEVSQKELDALKRFKDIAYSGGYYLRYKAPSGCNWDTGIERSFINAFKKLAKKARKQK